MSGAHYQRGVLLHQQGRHELAEREFRACLAAEPGDAASHSMLALCLVEREDRSGAEAEAREAVGLAPENPFAHYVLARVLLERNRHEPAAQAIAEAIRLDPDDADYRGSLAGIEAARERWDACLAAADAGLALDAEHRMCTNLRAMALRHLGRVAEAEAVVGEALRRDPENGLAHANQGWTLLHAGDPRGAAAHFREALRLAPDDDWARRGMIEAMKARNPVYRLILAYFLWMSRLSSGARWVVILGVVFGQQALKAARRADPALAPLIWPVSIALLLFVVMTWLAHPLSNLALFLSRDGRLALNRQERLAASLIGSCIAVALGSAAIWAGTSDITWAIVAIAAVVLAIPTAAIFSCEEGWPRRVMATYTIVLAGIGAVALTLLIQDNKAAIGLFQLFFIGGWLSTWAAAALTRATPTR